MFSGLTVQVFNSIMLHPFPFKEKCLLMKIYYIYMLYDVLRFMLKVRLLKRNDMYQHNKFSS